MKARLPKEYNMSRGDMEKTREEIENTQFEASAGGDAIKAVVNGKKEVVSVKLKEEIVDPDDIEMLEDLIVAAVNEAIRNADEKMEEEMGKLTGGMNIPGLF